MFPDLRILISATVATFFLAATMGLYASLRTQDQIVARTESRTAIDDSPITRISSNWPLPEPSRAAAMRELTRIAKHPPFADGDVHATRGDNQSGMPASESPAPDATGSTGIAVAPESASDPRGVRGNSVNAPETGNARTRAGKKPLVPAKKVLRVANRPVVKRLVVSGPGSTSGFGSTSAPVSVSATPSASVPRSATRRQPEQAAEPATSGYPLYSTVPVTN